MVLTSYTLLPDNMQPRVSITLAEHFGLQLRPPEPSTQIVKTKRGVSRHWMQKIFPFKMHKSVPVLVLED